MGWEGILGKGYMLARQGQLWVVTQQDPAADLAVDESATTSYQALAPTFMLKQAAASRRLLLRRLKLWLANDPGGKVDIIIGIDKKDRYTAATGTERTPKAPHMENSPTPGFKFYEKPTANAADELRIVEWARLSEAGDGIELAYDGEVAIGKTGSILVWAFAAVTGPKLRYAIEAVEERI